MEFVFTKTEFQFGLFTHHILIPFRFKNQLNIDTLNIIYALNFHPDIFNDKICCRAIWCSKGHLYMDILLIIYLNRVNQP